jgi:hypothetical protein
VREPPSPIGPTPEEQTLAENAMWDWYLEWAQIARATLHDRRLLRQLGFLERRGGAEGGEPLDEVSGTAEEEDEVALAATAGTGGCEPAMLVRWDGYCRRGAYAARAMVRR